MSDDQHRPGGNKARGGVHDVILPTGAVTLAEFRAAAIERGLGYFRAERFVVSATAPAAPR